MKLRRLCSRKNLPSGDRAHHKDNIFNEKEYTNHGDGVIVVNDGENECGEKPPTEQCASVQERTATENVLREYSFSSESEFASAFSSVGNENNSSIVCESITKPFVAKDHGIKGVLVGYWLKSTVPDETRKHAVTGCVDDQNRVRMYIQPYTREREPLTQDYPLPIWRYELWVSFDDIVLCEHLIGLNHLEVQEYVRIRSNTPLEGTREERIVAEAAAVRAATQGTKIDSLQPMRPAIRNGKPLNGFVPILPKPSLKGSLGSFSSQKPTANTLPLPQMEPLSNNHPTYIIVGCWKPPGNSKDNTCHAVYGIFGQNETFQFMVVQGETDTRPTEGNILSWASALWIPYEEVEFLSHLQKLTYQEVKEFCRIRQQQLDRGEKPTETIDDEQRAVFEAQLRLSIVSRDQPPKSNITSTTTRRCETDDAMKKQSQRNTSVQKKPRTSHDTQNNNANQVHSVKSVEQSQARVPERSAKNAAPDFRQSVEKNLAQDEIPPPTSEVTLPLAKRQKTLCADGADYVQMNGGITYERKVTGPLAGKLVSEGTVFNMNGEEYISYCVLAKVSFV